LTGRVVCGHRPLLVPNVSYGPHAPHLGVSTQSLSIYLHAHKE
jgi:hypothetical protein